VNSGYSNRVLDFVFEVNILFLSSQTKKGIYLSRLYIAIEFVKYNLFNQLFHSTGKKYLIL